MKHLLIAVLFLTVNTACKKTNNEISNPPTPVDPKYCWVIIDVQLIPMQTECDKTAKEIEVLHPGGYYYKSDEPLKCWFNFSTGAYGANQPASIVTKFFGSGYTIVTCGYCAQWFLREKRKYLPTGGITYAPTIVKRFCGDTLQTLFRGREIFLRQSVDSIITTQFSDNGINW